MLHHKQQTTALTGKIKNKMNTKKYRTGLYTYASAEYIREATQAEIALSAAAPCGVISVDGVVVDGMLVDGIACYVSY